MCLYIIKTKNFLFLEEMQTNSLKLQKLRHAFIKNQNEFITALHYFLFDKYFVKYFFLN